MKRESLHHIKIFIKGNKIKAPSGKGEEVPDEKDSKSYYEERDE